MQQHVNGRERRKVGGSELDEERTEQRAEALRKLAQGDGVLSSRYDEPIGGQTFELFEVLDKEELQAKVRELLDLMPGNKFKVAIDNALNSADWPGNLSERRNWLIGQYESSNNKVTYRTIIRHETEGALALARLYLVNTERSNVTVLELTNKVTVLEWMVTTLVELVGEEKVFEGLQFDEADKAAATKLMSQSFTRLHNEAFMSFHEALEAAAESDED